MDLKQQNAALTEQIDNLLLMAENRQLTEAVAALDYDARHVPLFEGWGDQVDTREYLHDTGWMGSEAGSYVPQLDDRKGGKYSPFFENEVDHAMTRGMGLVLSERYPTGVNATEALNNYTIGEGFGIEAIAPEGMQPNEQILSLANGLIKRFQDDNDWQADLESDIHDDARVRGETFVRLRVKRNRISADLLEPEQVTEPANARQLSEWAIGDILRDEFAPCWSFGVLRPERECDPKGYHVVYDGIGRDWDFFPADPIPVGNTIMGCVEHVKRNTPRNVKRGLSDFYPVGDLVKSSHTLLGNLGVGASMQAAIAWIVEHAPGVTETQVGSLIAGKATERVTRSYQTGSKTVNREKVRPGHVVHTPSGRKYQYGPLGQNNSPNYVLVEQAILRVAGTRWQFPEGLISGDWSNNNFASALIAEGPFVKSRERDQRYYASRFKRLYWKVLRMAHYLGWFRGASWEEVESSVDLAVKPPPVATRNKLEMAQENAILVPLGIRSARTACEQMGDDWEQEQERGAAAQTPATGTAEPPPAEFGALGRRQFTNNTKAVDDVLAGLRDGSRTDAQAMQLLQSLGLSGERAQALIDDAKSVDAMESAATLAEAVRILSEGYP